MEIGEVQSNNQMKQIHTRQSMVDSNPWQESLPTLSEVPAQETRKVQARPKRRPPQILKHGSVRKVGSGPSTLHGQHGEIRS